MKRFPDCTDVRTMRLAGTHDSYAYKQNMFVETQEWDVPTQLKNGIRFLDIRIGFANDLGLAHGPIHLGKTWTKDAIPEIEAFLRENPSECILLRLKNETNNPDLKIPLPSRLFLGELRGKALILKDVESHALDEYAIAPFGVSISDKKAHIIQRMHRISATKEWNVLFLSGTLGMQPGAVADCVNAAIEDELKHSKEPFGYFVLVLDYPTTLFLRTLSLAHDDTRN
jgi:hypothetical protein